MAHTDIDNAPINKQMKGQLKMLRQASTLYNMMNLIPSKAGWNLTISELEDMVSKVAVEYLGPGEVKLVTIDLSGHAKEPSTYVWIRRSSKHLVDPKPISNADNMAFTPPKECYSSELRKFVDQFGVTENPDGTPISRKKRHKINLSRDLNGDQSILAIPVSLGRVLWRVFDMENRGFLDTYGSDATALKCRIDCRLRFDTRGERRILTGIEVTKAFDNADRQSRRPRASGSFRDNRDRDDRNNRDED